MSNFPLSNPGLSQRFAGPVDLIRARNRSLFRPDLGRMTLTLRRKDRTLCLTGHLGVMVLLVGWKLIAGT